MVDGGDGRFQANTNFIYLLFFLQFLVLISHQAKCVWRRKPYKKKSSYKLPIIHPQDQKQKMAIMNFSFILSHEMWCIHKKFPFVFFCSASWLKKKANIWTNKRWKMAHISKNANKKIKSTKFPYDFYHCYAWKPFEIISTSNLKWFMQCVFYPFTSKFPTRFDITMLQKRWFSESIYSPCISQQAILYWCCISY